MKLKKGDWIAISVVIAMIQVICCWCIDISITGMLIDAQTGVSGYMTNGWNRVTPMFSYHLGIYGILISTVALVLIIIHTVLKEE